MFWSLQGHHKGDCIQRNTDTANCVDVVHV